MPSRFQPARTADVTRRLPVARRAARLGVLVLLVVALGLDTAGCQVPFATKALPLGVLYTPDGELQNLHAAILQQDAAGVGVLLDDTLLSFRLPGEDLAETRASLGGALIAALKPALRGMMLFVTPATIATPPGMRTEAAPVIGDPPIDAPLEPPLPDGSLAEVQARLISLADERLGNRLATTWRLRHGRWRLVTLAIDDVTVLPLRLAAPGAASGDAPVPRTLTPSGRDRVTAGR